MAAEHDVTAWFTRLLVEDGALVIPYVATSYQSGWPDRLIWHRDWAGLVELKGPKTRLDERQAANLRKLWRRRPGGCYVVRGLVVGTSATVQRVVGETGIVTEDVGQFTTAEEFIRLCQQMKQ